MFVTSVCVHVLVVVTMLHMWNIYIEHELLLLLRTIMVNNLV